MTEDIDDEKKALTSIRAAYTLSATPNEGEVERMMLRNFMETLAEVAMAIAARGIKKAELSR